MRLADLGYAEDLVLQGARPAAGFTFPLPADGIAGGTLTLQLRPSQALDSRASVQVALNGQPALSTTIGQLGKSGRLTIPVGAIDKPFLSVRVSSGLLVNDAVCADVDSGGLWLVIAKESTLQYQAAVTPNSIRGFLQMPGGQVRVRGLWDTAQQRADSIALYSVLKRYYRDTPTSVLLSEDAAPTENTAVREVALTPNAPAALQLAGATLAVAAGHDALSQLVAQAGQPLLLGRSLAGLNVAPAAAPAAARDRLTFDDLGIRSQERAGTGELPVSARFTLADLGGWPHDLRFRLDSAFDQVPRDTLERAFVRVRLNGTLIDTIDIRGQSTLQREIALPSQLVQAENHLETAFVYTPVSGNCQGAPYNFAGQVHGGSALIWSGYDAARGQLSELIGSFRGPGRLYLLDETPEGARAAAHLVGNLSMYTAEPLTPTLADPATLGQPDAGYRIVLGGDSTVAHTLELPVDLGSDIAIRDPQTDQVVLRGQPDQPLVSAQYVAGDNPTLVVQRSAGADTALLDATIARMTDKTRFFELNGGVVIGDASDILALDLSRGGFQAEQAATTQDWMSLLAAYRWLLLIPAALLIAGLWWQIYRRVGRRAPLPVHPIEAQPEQAA